MSQGFSGRSLLGVFSAPVLTQASHRQAQSLCDVPAHPATGWAGGVSSRCQVPGRRHSRADRVATRSGGESELGLRLIGSYLFTVAGFTRSQPQPSARFPWLHRPKSKPVTPMLTCQATRPPRGPQRQTLLHNTHDANIIPAPRPAPPPLHHRPSRPLPSCPESPVPLIFRASHPRILKATRPKAREPPRRRRGNKNAPVSAISALTGADRQGRAGPDGRASPETRLWSHHGD